MKGKNPDKSLQYVKGVGPRIYARLQKRGLNTIRDALYFFPRTYQDRRILHRIRDLKEEGFYQVKGSIVASDEVRFPSGKRCFEVFVEDDTGIISLKWLNYNLRKWKLLYCKRRDLVVYGYAKFFQGNLEYLKAVRGVVDIPLLRKDFIFDEYQIYESRAWGADAVLLIAAMLSRSQAEELSALSAELGLAVLFEVHHWKEVDTALLLDMPIIGINNRNLKTLQIDLQTTVELLKDIPPDRVVVSESGISTRADVEFISAHRVDAILIGTAIMKAEDIRARIRELFK